jgi:hypothetical protein
MRAWEYGFVATALAGCGGETGDSASCGGGDPCGGDVAGTWSIAQVCLGEDSLSSAGFDEPECAGAVQNVDADASGTYDFGSDGMMTYDATVSTRMTLVLDGECFTALGAAEPSDAACSALEGNYDELGSDPNSSIGSASCTFSGGTCRCDIEGKVQEFGSSGAYTITGTDLTDSDGDTMGYCVSGGTLTLFPPSTSSVDGTIVLRR